MTVVSRLTDIDAFSRALRLSGSCDQCRGDADALDAADLLDETVAELRLALAREATLREALNELDAWASRMPDAGLTDADPRRAWYFARPRIASSGRETP